MKIVLSMVTKNSAEKVGRDFADVWISSLQVPYDLIILIDDSDNDKTRKFVEKFADEHNKELLVERSRLYGWHKPTRATARQTALDIFFQTTDAEWLFFLDDDVILRDGWWEEARRYVAEERVGLIWGVELTERWEKRLRYLQARKVDPVEYSIRNFLARGGLHDTLLRREAIENIALPPWLNVYEDAWVKRFVECSGYEWRIVKTGALHLRSDWQTGYTPSDKELFTYADAILRLNPASLTSLLKAAFGLPAYLYYGWRSGNNGLEIWKARVSYRYQLLKARRRCRVQPCKTVLEYRHNREIIDSCVRHIFQARNRHS